MSAIAAGCVLSACSSSKKAVDSGVRQDSALTSDAPLVPGDVVAAADVEDGAVADTPSSGPDARVDLGSDVHEDGQLVADAADTSRDEGTDGGRDAGPETSDDGAAREAGADQVGSDGGRVEAGALDGGGEVIACVAPACCVPASLKPEDIWIDAAGSTLAITMFVTLSGANSQTWEATANVSVPGGQATCKTGTVVAKYSYVLIECPVIALDPMPACGSTMSIKVRLGTSTYSQTDGGAVSCSGDQSIDVERQLPVICPVCPASVNGLTGTPCEIVGQSCTYDHGSPMEALCNCDHLYSTGERKWMCMIM